MSAVLLCSAAGASRPPSHAGRADTVLLAGSPPSRSLVFDNVTVIDVEHGTRLPHQRVVIRGNRIRRMGAVSTVPVPAGAKVVDARGKYLIPGLWDMHTHAMRSIDLFYPLFIANGITGIRDASSSVPLDTLRLWRREILAGARVGPPRQLFSGPAIDDAKNCHEVDYHICVSDSASARRVVDSLKSAGADMLKTYDLGPAMYFAVAAEARREGLPFGGHLTAASAIEASDSGAAILDHPQAGALGDDCVYSTARQERCQAIAAHFRRNHTWWVPTLMSGVASVATHSGGWTWETLRLNIGLETRALLPRFAQLASAFWGGETIQADWLGTTVRRPRQVHLEQARSPGPHASPNAGGFLRLSQRVGLPILAGTDVGEEFMQATPPGFSLHEELAMYAAEGLTPLHALRTTTLNPAMFLHGTDSLGTVAPGKLADLVLLDADPLVAITNTTAIRAVVANGRYFDRAALDHLVTEAQLHGS